MTCCVSYGVHFCVPTLSRGTWIDVRSLNPVVFSGAVLSKTAAHWQCLCVHDVLGIFWISRVSSLLQELIHFWMYFTQELMVFHWNSFDKQVWQIMHFLPFKVNFLKCFHICISFLFILLRPRAALFYWLTFIKISLDHAITSKCKKWQLLLGFLTCTN